MTRAILFDFDGVLADTEPLHFETWAQVLAPLGIGLTWEHYRREMIGLSNREMIERLCHAAGRPYSAEFFTASYNRKKLLYAGRLARECQVSSALVGTIRTLRESYDLGIVSSSERCEVEPLLEGQGIGGWFRVWVCGEDVENHKPAPDPYLLALRRLNDGAAVIAAAECLVVEDSEAGEQAARAAGMGVVRVGGPEDVVERLRAKLASLTSDNGYYVNSDRPVD